LDKFSDTRKNLIPVVDYTVHVTDKAGLFVKINCIHVLFSCFNLFFISAKYSGSNVAGFDIAGLKVYKYYKRHLFIVMNNEYFYQIYVKLQ